MPPEPPQEPPQPRQSVPPPGQPQPNQYFQQPQPDPRSSIPGLPQNPTPNQKAPKDQGMENLSSIGKKYFKLIEFDDNEVLVKEIRKHPFGLFVIILTGSVIAFTVFVVTLVLASSNFLDSLGASSNGNAVIAFIGFILAVLILLVTVINAILYRSNVVFVTNEKIAQILYISLFNRKVSQLNIGDVQDVTVNQKGFLPNLIGYGTLIIETAGEQQNYTFTFVPQPYEASRVIISSNESNLHKYGN